MTSTAMPTAEQHGLVAHSDGAFVPVQTRSERFRSANVDDFAPVNGRELEWKLSPVAAFADLTGGELDGSRLPIETTDAPGIARFARALSTTLSHATEIVGGRRDQIG